MYFNDEKKLFSESSFILSGSFLWNIFRWVIKKIIIESVENVNFVEISTQKKETNCFSENNDITLNETECRSSLVQHASKSNQSDNESHKYSLASSKKHKVSLDLYQGFANKLNILCEQSIWTTDKFYSSSVANFRKGN